VEEKIRFLRLNLKKKEVPIIVERGSKMEKIRFIFFLLLAYLILSLGLTTIPLCGEDSKPKERLNLLLITIDTLRADRLSCYSSKHLKTPNIDSLANKGIIFAMAFAHTSTTLPSHSNILLGTTPVYHGVHDNTNFVVRYEFLTLAEHLKQSGYQTGAFIGAFPLDSRFGLSQGFDIYDDDYDMRKVRKTECEEREAQIVVDRALEWLNKRNSPWFLWIHCWDPHDPYIPPEPFRTQYADRLYDGEVAYVDFVMGKLFNFLEDNSLFKKTLVVFTGDHGEMLEEHGEKTHGFFAYNSAIWIPLIICAPGMKSRIVRQNVSHIDLFPTICDILRIKKPPFLQGISLLPSLKGKKLKKRTIYFESLSPYFSMGWAPIRGIIHGRDKFIDSPIPEFYDLKKDFDELQNLAGRKELDRYRKRLNQIILDQSSGKSSKAAQGMDRETLEKLRSLGYIANFKGTEKEEFSVEDDVKILLPYHNKSVEALGLCNEGKVRDAMELLKEVITERKNVSAAYLNLAMLYADQGRMNDTLEVLRMGLDFLPTNYRIFSDYISYLMEAEQLDEAIKAFEGKSFLQLEFDPVIWNYIGLAYLKKGNLEKARRHFSKSISVDRKFPIPYNNLAAVHFSLFKRTKDTTQYQKALENFKKAIELDPYYSTAHNGLGIAYMQAENYEEAIIHMEKALELQPDLYETLYYLGVAYMNNGDKLTAYAYFNRLKVSPIYHRIKSDAKAKLKEYILKCKPRPKDR
jgi:arylsulfatase A-like enzyme/Flp pilus assembly protein TadD